MHPKTEEFLYFLLWTADSLARPTWLNLNTGFEAWAWRNGLGYQLAQLQRRQLLEVRSGSAKAFSVRLTESGRRCALGGRDPTRLWNRKWDGKWRMVVFDIPVEQSAERQKLWRYLRAECFGYLQNSLWITPDPIDTGAIATGSKLPNVEALVLFEARPHGGESDQAVVDGAWDFRQINEGYASWRVVFDAAPVGCDPKALHQWARRERRAWRAATRADPFLPCVLWPKDYAGQAAWQTRIAKLPQIVRRVGS